MKISYPILGLSLTALTLGAFADEAISSSNKSEKEYIRNSLGVDAFWEKSSQTIAQHYHVDTTGMRYTHVPRTVNVEETNIYEGLRWINERLKPNSYYLAGDLWFAVGKNTRKAYVDGRKIFKKNISSNLWMNADIGLGYNFQPLSSPHFLLSIYSGPGYHFEHKCEQNAHWYYWMAGIKVAQDLTNCCSLGLDFKTLYSFALQDSHFVTVSERHGQTKFWGIEFGTPFTWHLGAERKFDLTFKPYLLKFNVNSPGTIFGSRLEFGYSY